MQVTSSKGDQLIPLRAGYHWKGPGCENGSTRVALKSTGTNAKPFPGQRAPTRGQILTFGTCSLRKTWIRVGSGEISVLAGVEDPAL